MKSLTPKILLGTFGMIAAVLAACVVYGDIRKKAKFETGVNALTSVIDHAKSFTEHGEQLGDRVINLPEDGHAYYTLLITSDNYAANTDEARLVNSFAGGNVPLTKLATQTHYAHYCQSNPLYRNRYVVETGDVTPCVMVKAFDGTPVYKASGANVPKNPAELAREIATRLASTPNCPNCPHPLHPTPTPTPTPTPDVKPAVPDMGIPETAKDSGGSNALGIGLAAFAVMFSLFFVGGGVSRVFHP